jgi:hypothetical protein
MEENSRETINLILIGVTEFLKNIEILPTAI